MARSTFKVLFYLKRQNEKNGKVPVMGRITVNGMISQFSCKLNIRPALWDTEANKARGKSAEAQRINEKLENIKTNIGKQYQRICDRDSYVTAESRTHGWVWAANVNCFCRPLMNILLRLKNVSAKIGLSVHSKIFKGHASTLRNFSKRNIICQIYRFKS